MLHVLAYDGDGSKSTLGVHREHGTSLYLLGKLAVKNIYGSLGILIAHTYRCGVLRRSLRHHKHAYAIVGQGCKDASVYTNDTHHRQTRYCYKRSAVDTRYTLDWLRVVVYLCLDNSSLCFGVECILNANWNILYAYRIYRWRINNLCTKVAKLHCLDITKLVYSISGLYYTRVGCHKAIDIGPYLEYVGIEGSCNNSSGIVGTTTSEIGCLIRVAVHTYKTRNKRYAW